MSTTVQDLPALLRAARQRLAQDCPAGGDTAVLRLMVIGAIEWAELLAGVLADRTPGASPAEIVDIVEVPRVPRFGAAEAASSDRGLSPGRPHP